MDDEFDFVARNFSALLQRTAFIEWCVNQENEERIEIIMRNENLHVNNEDELLSFILDISKDGGRFIHLLEYVHLEYCTHEACARMIEFVNNDDILQSKHYRDAFLKCISKRILNNNMENIENSLITKRYNQTEIDRLKENSIPHLKEKIGLNEGELKYIKESLDEANIECEDIDSMRERIRLLLPITRKPEKCENDIFTAINHGNLLSVRYFIENERVSVETKNKNGYTPFLIASLHGELQIMKYLDVVCHVNVNETNINGYTALHLASRHSNTKVIEYLVEQKRFDVNQRTKDYGWTPLIEASYFGNISAVKYFIEKMHVDPEQKSFENNYNALHEASNKGQIEVVKYLIENCKVSVTESDIDCAKIPEVKSILKQHFK